MKGFVVFFWNGGSLRLKYSLEKIQTDELGVKVGIVITVKDPGIEFDSWICYHLSIGFDKIYIFFDDPNDHYINMVKRYSNYSVQVIPRSDRLLNRWKKTKVWENFRWWIDVEVMARQCLNAEIGLELALKDGISWLLHIDADELFYAPDYNNIHEHFEQLHRQNFDQAVYLNYEGVPEQLESENFFKTITLFKQNTITIVSQTSYDKYNEWWDHKATYFTGYWTGKAAIRVSKDVYPLEVTRFYKKDEKRANFDGPIILHYINPTYSHTKKKYQTLGKFEDMAFNQKYVDRSQLSATADLPQEGQALQSHRQLRDIFHSLKSEEQKKQEYMRMTG